MTKFISFQYEGIDGEERDVIIAANQIKMIHTDIPSQEELSAEETVKKAYFEALDIMSKELGENVIIGDFQQYKDTHSPIGSIVIETVDGDRFEEFHYEKCRMRRRFYHMRMQLVENKTV